MLDEFAIRTAEVIAAEEAIEEVFSQIPKDQRPSEKFFDPPQDQRFKGTSMEARFICTVIEAYGLLYERSRVNSAFIAEYAHLADTSADKMKFFRDKIVHDLRTSYAHYLNPKEKHSQIIYRQCEAWYSEILGGKIVPEDEAEYETCTLALIEEVCDWLNMARQILKNITALNSEQIYRQWFIQANNNLLPFQKVNIIQEIAKKLNIPYDAGEVYRLHHRDFDSKISMIDTKRPDYLECVKREFMYVILNLSEYPMPPLSKDIIATFEVETKHLRSIIPTIKRYYMEEQGKNNILGKQELLTYAEETLGLKRR